MELIHKLHGQDIIKMDGKISVNGMLLHINASVMEALQLLPLLISLLAQSRQKAIKMK